MWSECGQPGMSPRHPPIFLNDFASFAPIFSHSTPTDFPIKSGTIPQVAWNLQLSTKRQSADFDQITMGTGTSAPIPKITLQQSSQVE